MTEKCGHVKREKRAIYPMEHIQPHMCGITQWPLCLLDFVERIRSSMLQSTFHETRGILARVTVRWL